MAFWSAGVHSSVEDRGAFARAPAAKPPRDDDISTKARGEEYVPDAGSAWKGGADTFLNQGTNGRWREVLSQEELAQYDALCDSALTAHCRAWLEHGRSYETR